MTISIWRYSHLALAITASVFILLASVTGIILAFQPISEQLQPYKVEDLKTISLDQTVNIFKQTYPEVLQIEVDANQFVSASVITKDGKNLEGYFNPKTANYLGEKISPSKFFQFTTNLHRSLFLKSTGRFLVALGSFLLLLIAITGFILVVKRQSGIKHFFAKIVKENPSQYWHIVLGRWSLVPIIIITITGVYLSLLKFDVITDQAIKHNVDFEALEASSTEKSDSIFGTITLDQVKHLEFPFSEFVEDYYTLKLKDKELLIHQYSGEILSEQNTSLTSYFSTLSLNLHTGKGSIIWSVILLIATINILYFMYSGFDMTLRRKKNTVIPKNKYTKDQAKFIILVGSETGSTYRFASALFNSLINAKHSVFISDLNSYSTYKNAEHLIVFTATYGDGEAPINANKFLDTLKNIPQKQSLKFSVIGFGSLQYKAYCQFAKDVNNALNNSQNFTQFLPLKTINNQSLDTFKNWCIAFNLQSQLDIEIPKVKHLQTPKNLQDFKVVSKSEINQDYTFVLTLQTQKIEKIQSGDLLSVFPKEDQIERLYSLGKFEDKLVLSVKKHQFGVCSNYFSQLKAGEIIKARINKNPSFYLPKHTKHAVFIANGTGIGPFLGMINQNPNIKKHLFWGTRTQASVNIYDAYLNEAKHKQLLTTCNIAYSKEGNKAYVQDIIAQKDNIIASVLEQKGVVMICGSVAMQTSVLDQLDTICQSNFSNNVSYFIDNGQIKMDCY